jgi:D-alanyl-D-alanine carboxypeptidase/D-alanyl-D-alanine-endopeptidase (penicillin-binding protein 4)
LQGAAIGVALETVEGSKVYDYQGNRRFVPASTQKLLTTAAALAQWGGDRTWATTIYLSVTPETRELWVVGQGDPTFTDQSLRALAQAVAQQLQQRQMIHLDPIV